MSTESDSGSAISGKEFSLPAEPQVWPRKDGSLKEIPTDQDDFPHDQVRNYTQSQKWQWSGQRVFFFCDLHADAEGVGGQVDAGGRDQRDQECGRVEAPMSLQVLDQDQDQHHRLGADKG